MRLDADEKNHWTPPSFAPILKTDACDAFFPHSQGGDECMLFEQVCKIIAEQFAVEPETITMRDLLGGGSWRPIRWILLS
jgi:hypothetical protein